ncbi:hypothetical protein CHARACLAT_016187 [Characodon lateralis]|uniref:Uncharacterized protein n=1 Tax=Characodon lateralis TaxID=208331 RepID=A0ABU7EU26_9TELE|nr:hypothetical protein [Characodon lateralis]
MHGVCTLTCIVNCGILYRQVCAFPNHIQSTEFTSGGFHLSCRSISRMISGNSVHLSSVLSFMIKDVNTWPRELLAKCQVSDTTRMRQKISWKCVRSERTLREDPGLWLI